MPSVKNTDRNSGFTILLFSTSTWVLLSPPMDCRETGPYCLTSLSEKTRKSNHLQILKQRQHLLNYFKTLSVGPAGNRNLVSRTIDWHLTNYANQAVGSIGNYRQLSERFEVVIMSSGASVQHLETDSPAIRSRLCKLIYQVQIAIKIRMNEL